MDFGVVGFDILDSGISAQDRGINQDDGFRDFKVAKTSSVLGYSWYSNMQGGRGAFSPSQWMELEHQALIYKYISSNVAVPSYLLNPIRRAAASVFPALRTNSFGAVGWGGLHWGYCSNDPEPGRCRRTDGKKWRCSRDAVADQKYCERHMNRGRHRQRSRKPVEGESGHSSTAGGKPNPVPSSSHQPELGLLCYDSYAGDNVNGRHVSKSQPNSLRQFIDDCPKTDRPTWPDATHLSISIPTATSDKEAANWVTNPWMGGPLGEVLHCKNGGKGESSSKNVLDGCVGFVGPRAVINHPSLQAL